VENRPGAAIRLYPKPECGMTVFTRYTKARTTSDLQNEDESWVYKLVESHCCDVIFRKLTCGAGISVGRVKYDGKSASFWQAEAIRLRLEGWDQFERQHYNTGTAADRS